MAQLKYWDGSAWVDAVIGAPGPAGTNGTNGQGVPTGGTAGQVLSKIDSTDYNTQWVAQTGGGGGAAGDSDQTILPVQIFS